MIALCLHNVHRHKASDVRRSVRCSSMQEALDSRERNWSWKLVATRFALQQCWSMPPISRSTPLTAHHRSRAGTLLRSTGRRLREGGIRTCTMRHPKHFRRIGGRKSVKSEPRFRRAAKLVLEVNQKGPPPRTQYLSPTHFLLRHVQSATEHGPKGQEQISASTGHISSTNLDEATRARVCVFSDAPGCTQAVLF